MKDKMMRTLVPAIAVLCTVACKQQDKAEPSISVISSATAATPTATPGGNTVVRDAAIDAGGGSGAASRVSENRKPDLNVYVLRAVDALYKSRKGQGYSAGSYFTHDLDYQHAAEIRASSRKPATMCVAAVSEVIIEALNQYVHETGDATVFARLPARSWNGRTTRDLRSHIFMFDTVHSNGTADALHQFGLGEEVPFKDLVPGDFVGLNRNNGSGHAVVFMGFLNASGGIEITYDSRKVVGFKYFSSQGKNRSDAGLGFRWAFFGPCPAWREADKPRDCGIVRSEHQHVLNTGYMLDPSKWTIETAIAAKERRVLEGIVTRHVGRPSSPREFERLPFEQQRMLQREATQELSRILPEVSRLSFDGATTDD
jgi:hypothetical protein